MLIRVFTDGGAGMRAQATGLARAVAALGGAEISETIAAPKITNVLPLSAAAGFCQIDGAPPDMVIGCGGRAQPALLAAKKKFGAFAVCIQRPRGGGKMFDAVVAPRHDYSPSQTAGLEKDGGMMLTLGAVGNVNAAALSAAAARQFAGIPMPKTGVLIGGENRAFSMTAQFCREFAESILAADLSGGVLATASRRTGAEQRRVFAEVFSGGRCFFYDGAGADNPYLDILAAADRFVITGDSVNMLSEVCAAKKPAQIAELPQKSARAAAKFHNFHGALITRGLARRWCGKFEEWTPPGLDETARAAEFVWARYCAARRVR